MANRYAVGSYYSPVPDTRELAAEPRRSQVWPPVPHETPGIDWNEKAQLALCREAFAGQERLPLARGPSEDPLEFVTSNDYNGMFKALDAWVLEAMLRHLEPARMVEVGAGFSSLMSARVNRECLGGAMRYTAIEPHPRDFLHDLPGLSELRVEQVQDTPLELFAELGEGDLLLIDTSHTVKTGGDVPWIYNQILPRLAPGVVVHLHDVFLPHDYPTDWVLEGWAWNELYLVQSFLAFNSAFEILFSAEWMLQHHETELLAAFPGYAPYLAEDRERRRDGQGPFWWNSSGSLWLRRRP